MSPQLIIPRGRRSGIALSRSRELTVRGGRSGIWRRATPSGFEEGRVAAPRSAVAERRGDHLAGAPQVLGRVYFDPPQAGDILAAEAIRGFPEQHVTDRRLVRLLVPPGENVRLGRRRELVSHLRLKAEESRPLADDLEVGLDDL